MTDKEKLALARQKIHDLCVLLERATNMLQAREDLTDFLGHEASLLFGQFRLTADQAIAELAEPCHPESSKASPEPAGKTTRTKRGGNSSAR